MQLTLNLPDREDQLALNRSRWAEVHEDRMWADHPYRIETNAFGQIIMTPPPAGAHSSRQGEILFQLRTLLGGRAFPECPISTIGGVRAADVGWYSDERYAKVRGALAFEIAPEICVEVLSPRNTDAEIESKFDLYFDAGAIECWVCDLSGQMVYFARESPRAPQSQSLVCKNFPVRISD